MIEIPHGHSLIKSKGEFYAHSSEIDSCLFEYFTQGKFCFFPSMSILSERVRNSCLRTYQNHFFQAIFNAKRSHNIPPSHKIFATHKKTKHKKAQRYIRNKN